MMIELNTNYAYKLKYIDQPSLDKVRKLAVQFMMELPQQLREELHEALNHGLDILDSEPQMVTYLYSFGQMHQAKLNYAFGKLPDEFIQQNEINIIDYGCGQAIGTMCYADYLRKNDYSQKVKTITLMEPSEICLNRAALHASVFFPDAEIKTVNKKFETLTGEDIECDEDVPTLHILSNVLDLDFDLDSFASLVKSNLKGYNQFVCAGPYFGSSNKGRRMEDFCSLLDGKKGFYGTFDKNELVEDKTWTAQILCFPKGEVEEQLSTKATDEDICNGEKDEYGAVYSKDGTKILRIKSELQTYVIKNGTKVICDDAFHCKSLQQIIIPNSVEIIGNFAFWRCRTLQQITIPDSVTNIGDYAFNGCKSLQQITIPDSVTNIGDSAFSWCKSLQQITIPDSVTNIGDSAFSYCESLQQITIPNSVKSIGKYVFEECTSLQRITIPNSVTNIGDSFDGCVSLQKIVIPHGTTEKFKNMLDKELRNKLIEG